LINESKGTVMFEKKKKVFNKHCLIGELLPTVKDIELKSKIKLEFYRVDSLSYQIDNKIFNFIFEKIKNEDEAGDFHKIRILHGEKNIDFFNPDGWIFAKHNLCDVPHLIDNNLVSNDYVIIQKASPNNILLFAFGYIYANDPSLLSIINLNYFEDPQLIFNSDYMLYNIKDFNNDQIKDIEVSKLFIDENPNKKNIKKYCLIDGYFAAILEEKELKYK
jgi:hypothetical protein